MKLSDIKDKNHSLFGQLKDLEADNVSLTVQIEETHFKLDLQEKRIKSENLAITNEISRTKHNKMDNENKFEERSKNKEDLELM